jgi:hypothetical protein
MIWAFKGAEKMKSPKKYNEENEKLVCRNAIDKD